MSHLLIKKLNVTNLKAAELSFIFAKENLPFHAVSCMNWFEYPYKPDVKFRIAHNSHHLLLNFQVEESDIKAVCDKDNGNVWEDSCVEFFISFAKDVFYYNIECNCIGKILVATGIDRQMRERIAPDIVRTIERWSSVGDSPVENQSGAWELSLIIPLPVFHLSRISSFDGLRAKGNFYKCGDKLAVPHYLSWNPIKNGKPNFHLTAFFGEILFE
ncbi:MAG: hypothetical protein LBU22_10310 [Dysgonamonadaceae bacterium]|jgi:hypothetical protein|nr:hypothetical protein [Dysgonamonadaceae bacterium]